MKAKEYREMKNNGEVAEVVYNRDAKSYGGSAKGYRDAKNGEAK